MLRLKTMGKRCGEHVKETFEKDNVLDLVWDNHCDARSRIKDTEIPYKKLYQAEKFEHVRLKNM